MMKLPNGMEVRFDEYYFGIDNEYLIFSTGGVYFDNDIFVGKYWENLFSTGD